jgi:hypothetical protein
VTKKRVKIHLPEPPPPPPPKPVKPGPPKVLLEIPQDRLAEVAKLLAAKDATPVSDDRLREVLKISHMKRLDEATAILDRTLLTLRTIGPEVRSLYRDASVYHNTDCPRFIGNSYGVCQCEAFARVGELLRYWTKVSEALIEVDDEIGQEEENEEEEDEDEDPVFDEDEEDEDSVDNEEDL